MPAIQLLQDFHRSKLAVANQKNGGSFGQRRQGEAFAADQRIGGAGTFGDRADHQPAQRLGRQILEAVDGEIDPSAAQVIIDLQARGVPATAADNSVRDGIHRVQNLIEAGRLRVSSACYNLIDEGKRYKWRTDRKENVIEVPVKIADHGMDAIRYPLYTYGEWRSAAAKVPTMEKSEAMWERRF